MTQEELNKIIENHQHWLNEDCEGWENMRADLTNAVLRYADLTNADLTNADLTNADLTNADLTNAVLRRAVLTNAVLRHADLTNADLTNADLTNADLTNADLRHAVLRHAVLRRAVLTNADLRHADLRHFERDECTAFYDLQCPEEGEFVAFKKASNKIVKLRIPAEARRSSATSRKCRAEFADVLEILNTDKTKADVSEVNSNYDCDVIYKVGERVTADSWDNDRWDECSHGIHFFITFDEAVNY